MLQIDTLPIPWYCDDVSLLSFWGSFALSAAPLALQESPDAEKGRNGRLRHEREGAFKARSAHVTGLIFTCSDVLSGFNPGESCRGKQGPLMNIRPFPSQNRLVLGVPQVISFGSGTF